MSNRVFVLSNTKQPLMPCTPKRARKLLTAKRAAVYRMRPFTIILKDRDDGATQPVEFKTDPGSKTTGMALVGDFQHGRQLLWAANLAHRGQAIRSRIESRRSLRRSRRNRKTRYRPPRFKHRTRPNGWLPPSLRARVDNLDAWFQKCLRFAPVSSAAIETVRFDTQLMQNPEISGVGYQQGTLAGYEIREYLLEKWDRTCAYCDKQNVPLEIEHIQPRSKGGSNRVSNLAIACRPCNQRKGNTDIRDFLSNQPARLKRLLGQARAPLKDTAAVNATRYAIGGAIKAYGLPVSFWSGGRTKKNRTAQGYSKDHWIDAACVGETGEQVLIPPGLKPLLITATGRGNRQVVQSDKYGFPRGGPRKHKRIHGFQTGDLVRLDQPSGKYAGIWVGRLAGTRATGSFDIKTALGIAKASYRRFTLIQRCDGYDYG